MDPISRRQVWEFLSRAKEGRVIILTTYGGYTFSALYVYHIVLRFSYAHLSSFLHLTFHHPLYRHSMTEASLLSDKIIIMSEGQCKLIALFVRKIMLTKYIYY